MLANPRRRRHSWFLNRSHRRHRRHYRHNPIIRNPGGTLSLGSVMRDPMHTVTQGFVGIGAAYLTNSIPNMFGFFPGTDLVQKLLRGLIRVVVGGFVYGAAKSFMPRQAPAAAAGAAIGSIGATVLDILNTRLVLGFGDVTQTPGMLFGGVGSVFSNLGIGAYSRPMGAYSLPMGRGLGGVYGPGSMGMLNTGSGIYN